MRNRDRRQLLAAFAKVHADIKALERRADAYEGDVLRTIKVNLKELKDKLADGLITPAEYDERSKRVVEWDLR
jgi:hypothetical protein